MKLEEIVKFRYFPNKHLTFVWFIFFFQLSYSNLKAQNYTFDFSKGVTIAEALETISGKLDIKIAYDAGKLNQIFINRIITGNSINELLENLLRETDFILQYKYERYLIIPMPKSGVYLKEPEYQLLGTVKDDETGELLPFATVVLTNQNLSTSASEAGTFAFKGIKVNPLRLKITFIGFHTLDTLIYNTNANINHIFRLSRKIQMMDSIVIKGEKLDMVDLRNDVDFSTTLNPFKITDLPIVVEPDIFKTLQLLPGISYTSNSSELSIRGGSSDQNLILFDGQTLYNLSHYYGVVSTLNPNVIKDIQIFKGGYDSRYGERVSGIVDIQGKSGNLSKPSLYGDINMVSGNITAEIPFGKKLSLVAAYRRSYSDIYHSSLSNKVSDNKPNGFKKDSNSLVYYTTPSFHFYDYNAKMTYYVSDKENVSLSIFGSKDFFDNSYNDETSQLSINTVDRNNWSSFGYSASWLKQWNETFFSNFQAGTSGYTNEFRKNDSIVWLQNAGGISDKPYLPDQVNNFKMYNKNDLTDVSLSLRNTCYLNNHNILYFGILARKNSIYYHKDADGIYIYDNINESSWFSSIYGQDKILLGEKLTVKPGFRLNYYQGTKQLYLEPRLSLNYRFSSKFSVRLATGNYYQFISQVLSQSETGYNKNFWVLANDSNHQVLKSNHFVIGSTIESGNFLLDAELYYKNFKGLQEYIFASNYYSKDTSFTHFLPKNDRNRPMFSNPYTDTRNSMAGGNSQPVPKPIQASYFLNGSGESYGIDLFVRFKSQKYTSWISYSLSKSIHWFSDINNGMAIPAPADQTHQLSFTNMLKLGNWNLGLTTLYSTGRPYINYALSSEKKPIKRVYERLPDYFRTDFSVNYNISFNFIRLKAGATLVNVFDTKNYFDINTRKFDFDNTSFAETNLIRSQNLSLILFLHFEL